ncbi:Crp/Fnr family transcriptional regulator [Tenacibaculum sp. M341]|uniref:Crp/Fnr family transcriptional regulator n=1 Tax=Tenacibaculum sp. M341 TaxID=2530339 RepID=UPI0010451CFA|nr:Crp/Fnr family transcriptional regulator [Tenacibaculum sp. M341]TCI89969.1 Crp/Fnr family transcriptional regulator [Tenacibaculum sp. M341]
MHEILFNFISKYITITEEEKKAIISLGVFKSEKKGSILLKEGQFSNESFFVLKGCLRSYYIIKGEEKTTSFHTEMTAINALNQTSEKNIACVENSIVLVSNPELEIKMFEKFPKFESLCRILSEEVLNKQQIDFDLFKILSPEERYLNILKTKPDLIQRVPQHQLASFIGVKPQSLSRIRSRITAKEKTSIR